MSWVGRGRTEIPQKSRSPHTFSVIFFSHHPKDYLIKRGEGGSDDDDCKRFSGSVYCNTFRKPKRNHFIHLPSPTKQEYQQKIATKIEEKIIPQLSSLMGAPPPPSLPTTIQVDHAESPSPYRFVVVVTVGLDIAKCQRARV